MKISYLVIALIFSSSVSAQNTNQSSDYIVSEIISVYDGDTFRANINELPDIVGKNIAIRILGIDTPEIKGECEKEKTLAIKARDFARKALFNADQSNENELLDILKPLINSESVWKSHALYLMAEFFYSKNEKQKSKEFFNQIIILDNANDDIARKAQKRLNRDLSE